MRTLALLAALLLLALRGQAGPLAKPADGGTEAEDPLPAQALAGTQDPNVTISFALGARPSDTCFCRPLFCLLEESRSGTCYIFDIPFAFCCN